eukprot:TRINITY_DN36720_c0_g1_i1.p1 TRINITY_DN36720_c0_g1~~TRINITY_DN36720_c0_g1_i1.p1  ORF type:complete len:369 (+),score=74.94 TRINITY_DN36720_c0_g1_i1:72-1178(+)
MTVKYILRREKEVSVKDYVKSVLVPSSKGLFCPDETRVATKAEIQYEVTRKNHRAPQSNWYEGRETVQVVKEQVAAGVPFVLPINNIQNEPMRIEIVSPMGEISSGVIYADSFNDSEGEPDSRDCRWNFEYNFDDKSKTTSFSVGPPDHFPELVDISKWVLIVHPYHCAEVLHFNITFGVKVPREQDILQPWMLASQSQWSSEVEQLIVRWFDEVNEKNGLKTSLYSYNPFKSGTHECFKEPVTQQTPLHTSCKGFCTKGAVRLVNALITKCEGISINDQDSLGKTPLHYAAEVVGETSVEATTTSYRNNISLVELLIKSKSDPFLKDNEGNTPLRISLKYDGTNGEITSLLRKAESSFSSRRSFRQL